MGIKNTKPLIVTAIVLVAIIAFIVYQNQKDASPVQYKGAFTQVMRDPNVHGILGSICPTAVTDVPAVTDLVIDIYETYKHL